MDIELLKRRQANLRNYVEKISPGIFDTRTAGLEALATEEEAILLEHGLEKLAIKETMAPTESVQLEAIIHTKFRPALFIIQDTFQAPPNPWTHLGETAARQNIESAAPLIGRIELPPEIGILYGGTGFVVGPGLLMTNRHVAEIFARGIGTSRLRFKPGLSAGVNFRKEVIPTPDTQDLTVTQVEMIHPFWDMALLRVAGLNQNAWLTLSSDDTDSHIGKDIAVIGYPAQDPRNDIDLQNQIFGGVYNVKRMQPGKLDVRRQVLSFGRDVEAITHDASTLGGNSGSAVIDVQSGEILALHFAGIYLEANFAVPASALASDQRVVDSGVKFSASVTPNTQWQQRWDEVDRVQNENLLDDTIADDTDPSTSDTADSSSIDSDNLLSFTVPLTITISATQPVQVLDVAVQLNQSDLDIDDAEGLFGGESNEIIKNAYRQANSSLLVPNTYTAAAALTAAAASHLVYSNNQAFMEQTCRSAFNFSTCHFLRENNTECFIATSNNTVLVCFRGTQGTSDWIANLNLSESATEFGMVHSGFLQGFLDIRGKLQAALDSAIADGHQIVLTGHSLGGALATIAASEWRNQYPIRTVYTFGQPAVGDRAFRNSMESIKPHFFRIVNDDDIVSRIPPLYKHVGTRFKLPPNRKLTSVGTESTPPLETTPTDDMLPEIAFHQLQNRLDPSLASTGQEGFLPSFSDHKITNYMRKLAILSEPAA